MTPGYKMESWVAPYVAGIMDGDGCIMISRHKTGIAIGVAVNMTDARVPTFLKEIYGGRLGFVTRAKGNENWKPVWSWRAESRIAERLLRDVQPFLLVKREQCDLALSVRDHMRNGGVLSRGKDHRPGCEKDVAIIAFREAAKTKMHELNKRGVN